MTRTVERLPAWLRLAQSELSQVWTSPSTTTNLRDIGPNSTRKISEDVLCQHWLPDPRRHPHTLQPEMAYDYVFSS